MTWSPDGRTLAVEAQDPNKKPPWCCRARITEIYVVPTDGSGARLLVTAREGDPTRVAGESRDPSWSPREDEIAYTAHGEVRAARADGSGTPRVITHALGPPTWSPDGRRLALFPGRPDWRYDSIHVVNADGSGLRRLTKHAYTEYGFAWSPDGRRILYGRENRLGISIDVIGADGRNNRRVTADAPAQGAWGAVTWSPDRRSIAYTTNSTGRGDLYVIDANGRNKLRLTRSSGIDLAPAWAPG
jgi:Tol biopolymer transport system component